MSVLSTTLHHTRHRRVGVTIATILLAASLALIVFVAVRGAATHPAVTPYFSGVLQGIGPGLFSPDHHRLVLWAVRRPQDLEGPAAIALIDVATGKVTPTGAVIVDPAALAWSPDSGRIFFSYGQRGLSLKVGVLTPGGAPSRLQLPSVASAQPRVLGVSQP